MKKPTISAYDWKCPTCGMMLPGGQPHTCLYENMSVIDWLLDIRNMLLRIEDKLDQLADD